ncbi:MAG: WG repeat-containing protein [Catonella sp.]|uniref:WG repeat-containing protein n=1 Tax=Catonella sp. TaxID=2382125 RepID=UPI003FA08146
MKSKKSKALLTVLLAAVMIVGNIQGEVTVAKAEETTIKWDKAVKKKYSWLVEKGYKLEGTIGNNLLKISNEKGDMFGLAKEDRTILYEPKYKTISEYSGPAYSWYYDGNIIIASEEGEGENAVYREGLISPDGEVILPLDYDIIRPFSEGLMSVSKNYKFAYLNTKFKVVIPYKYDDASFFNKGLAVVAKKNKYGAINKKGKTVIPFVYKDMSYDYEHKVYSVTKDFKNYGYINSKGKVLVPLKYDYGSEEAEAKLIKKLKKTK